MDGLTGQDGLSPAAVPRRGRVRRVAGVAAAVAVLVAAGYLVRADLPWRVGREPLRVPSIDGVTSHAGYWAALWEHVVYTADGLADSGGTARVWALKPGHAYSEQSVAAAAEALGVSGEPELTDIGGWGEAWSVGPRDLSGRWVFVTSDGALQLTDYTPWWGECPPTADDPTTSPDAGSVGRAPCPSRSADQRHDTAVTLVRDALGALGLDPDDYEYAVDDYGSPDSPQVTAHLLIDGMRTGVSWTAATWGTRLNSLRGSMADVVYLGEYDVISPAEAVQRLADSRFGSFSPAMKADGSLVADDVRYGVPPTRPQPAEGIWWPVDEVTITGATLALGLHTQPDGAAAVVPVYELIDDARNTWTVLALAEEHLDLRPGPPGESPAGDAGWGGGSGLLRRLQPRGVDFTAEGLSEAEATGRVWALDPGAGTERDVFTEETIRRIAAAFGVSGEPHTRGSLEGSIWQIGPESGPEPLLILHASGGVFLSDTRAGRYYCPPGTEPQITVPCPEQDLGPAPEAEAATAVVREALRSLGLDPAGFEVVAASRPAIDEWATQVVAYRLVDGRRSGISWDASVTSAGLERLSGTLAPLVDLGEVGVISPVEAVARLGDPRFGGDPLVSAATIPALYALDSTEPVGGPTAALTNQLVKPSGGPRSASTLLPGSDIWWPVDRVTITEAELEMRSYMQPDGAVLSVPTYVLTGDTGGVWTVIGVAAEHLDQAAGHVR